MKRAWLVPLVILSAIPAAQAAGVVGKIEHSRKSAHGWESRQGAEARRSLRHSASLSGEMNAAAILIPLMRRVEDGGMALSSPAVTRLVQSCKVFSATPLVGSAWAYCHGTGAHVIPYLPNSGMAQQILFGTGVAGGQTGLCSGDRMFYGQVGTAQGIEKAGMIPDSMLAPQWPGELKTRWFREAIPMYGARIAPPLFATLCYSTEAKVVADAERILADSAPPVVHDGRKVYEITQGEAERALVEAGSRGALAASMRLLDPAFSPGNGCVVPVKGDAAYNPSENTWSCAGVQVNAGQRSAQAGGLTILGDGAFWGRSLKVALTSESSAERSRSRSSSTFSNGEASTSGSATLNQAP